MEAAKLLCEYLADVRAEQSEKNSKQESTAVTVLSLPFYNGKLSPSSTGQR